MNRLKEVRTAKGLSQRKLANKVGISQQAIAMYETHRREPKQETWQALADALGVTVPYLQGYGMSEDEKKQAIIDLLNKEIRSVDYNIDLSIAIDDFLQAFSLPRVIGCYPLDDPEAEKQRKELYPELSKDVNWEDKITVLFASTFLNGLTDETIKDEEKLTFRIIEVLKMVTFYIETKKMDTLDEAYNYKPTKLFNLNKELKKTLWEQLNNQSDPVGTRKIIDETIEQLNQLKKLL